jgi:hypothetical protein
MRPLHSFEQQSAITISRGLELLFRVERVVVQINLSVIAKLVQCCPVLLRLIRSYSKG